MKKFLPFLFPMMALIIVAVLIFRWYGAQTATKQGKILDFADGTKIEELSATESSRLKMAAKDSKTVEMTANGEVAGQVRYDIVSGKVQFSITANLPEITDGVYQVWLESVDGSAKRKAFTLELEKGGYIGSGSISAETMPFAVVVSLEKKGDKVQGPVLLRGVITKEEK